MPDQPEQADVGTTQQFALVNFRARQVPTLVFFFPSGSSFLAKEKSEQVTKGDIYIFCSSNKDVPFTVGCICS